MEIGTKRQRNVLNRYRNTRGIGCKSGLALGGAGLILLDLGMTMVKNLPEPITSSYYRQLTAAWQRAVDNSEFIRTYAETLRVCAQNSRIPKPSSLLLLKPRFPF